MRVDHNDIGTETGIALGRMLACSQTLKYLMIGIFSSGRQCRDEQHRPGGMQGYRKRSVAKHESPSTRSSYSRMRP